MLKGIDSGIWVLLVGARRELASSEANSVSHLEHYLYDN